MKGYKTVIFNSVMTLAMLAKVFNPESDVDPTVAADTASQGVDVVMAGGAALWGIGNVLLRSVTNSPIFKKDSK